MDCSQQWDGNIWELKQVPEELGSLLAWPLSSAGSLWALSTYCALYLSTVLLPENLPLPVPGPSEPPRPEVNLVTLLLQCQHLSLGTT